ncbi:MAG: hypothetical protein HY726_20610 [Candidatus Rokubacteria bacterium]|nr:hypothetical protein [Candidatus Rokubacteria bacterium]
MTDERTHRRREGSRLVGLEKDSKPGSGEALKPARWTVLAYMAGDNDLESAALEDINEMERVGSRPGSVEVLVQVDRAADYDGSEGDWRSTRRYYITRGPHPKRITSTLLSDLGETNTGDPEVLEEFLRFGVKAFPARACALILWNHGSGFYVPPELLSRAGVPSRRELLARATPRLRRSFFHTTRERLLRLDPRRRGIAYDDGSTDCLDNRELKRVLRTAHRLLGRKVDLVGMDACLMTMLEVAYQIRNHASVLVGSEELEPGDGWPYDLILQDLVARPLMTADDLGKVIVHRYIESYRSAGLDVTQSAIDLSRLDDLVEAVDALARALLKRLPSPGLESALYTAWRRTVRFFDNFYVDLHHFAVNLATATDQREIRQACRNVQAIMDGTGTRSPILAEGHLGPRMKPVRGLSLYFPPFRDPSAFYRELDFARRTQWADFLETYLGERG